ncbi:MAG: dTDP-4-dehydrorhamnose 3,5-epimerase [Synergistales bacterium 53_16]|nr:MAG: dTDP-4-dehydrorhamnose 3,5-epimerase [Synergistales bacterium 53_16]
MAKITIQETPIPDLLVIEPQVFPDQRGYFLESFNRKAFKEAGLAMEFVQDNMSRSTKGVLRGLHFQTRRPQGKLVKVTRGKVFDVAVDLRKASPTFGSWYGITLDDEAHKMFYVPPGFAHGFFVLSEVADFHYKCTDFYDPGGEGGIRWDDPDINVDWPLGDIKPILSEKDQVLPFFKDMESPFTYEDKRSHNR